LSDTPVLLHRPSVSLDLAPNEVKHMEGLIRELFRLDSAAIDAKWGNSNRFLIPPPYPYIPERVEAERAARIAEHENEHLDATCEYLKEPDFLVRSVADLRQLCGQIGHKLRAVAEYQRWADDHDPSKDNGVSWISIFAFGKQWPSCDYYASGLVRDLWVILWSFKRGDMPPKPKGSLDAAAAIDALDDLVRWCDRHGTAERAGTAVGEKVNAEAPADHVLLAEVMQHRLAAEARRADAEAHSAERAKSEAEEARHKADKAKIEKDAAAERRAAEIDSAKRARMEAEQLHAEQAEREKAAQRLAAERARAEKVKTESVPVATQGTDKKSKPPRAVWVAQALILRRENPDWKKKRIADEVGIHPVQLSPKRCREFAALEAASMGKLPQGFVATDEDTRQQNVEAVSNADDKSDRGMPIAGSNLVREYCAECGESIRVRPEDVGTNRKCSDCAS